MEHLISETFLDSAKALAITTLYLVLFGTTVIEKWSSLSTPEWFKKQFEKTLLSKVQGGFTIGFRTIAVFELLLFLVFLVSLFNADFLRLGLVGAMFLFSGLCLGLRLTFDFQGSANMFIYFSASLLSFLALK